MNSRSSTNERIRFFSIADVAEWVGVSARTVRRWIKSGLLVAHRIRGVVRIAEHDLRQFLDAHRDD
jgi:excisionase family DNA binding protein